MCYIMFVICNVNAEAKVAEAVAVSLVLHRRLPEASAFGEGGVEGAYGVE